MALTHGSPTSRQVRGISSSQTQPSNTRGFKVNGLRSFGYGQQTWTKIILPAWILWWMHTKKHRRCYPQGMALSRTCLTEPPPEANRGTSSPPCTRSKISCHARIYESLVSTHARGTPSPPSIFGKTPCKARMLEGLVSAHARNCFPSIHMR